MKRLKIYSVAAIGFAILAGWTALGQAQTKAVSNNDPNGNQAKREQRRAGFSLMPAEKQISASSFTFTALGSGAGLPVLGGGTAGRLTKWTGVTSNNSFIGDSTIFEDKYGMVGIGTDTPTSKLTVMGVIESKGAGGFKFPDGTLQTTAAMGLTVPLLLEGSLPTAQPGILTVKNNGNAGVAIRAIGGNSNTNSYPGMGLLTVGGDSSGNLIPGGPGLLGVGGRSATSVGGTGVEGLGGDVVPGAPGPGGAGVAAEGGGAIFPGGSASGGSGVITTGGLGKGIGFHGGTGVVAFGGSGIDGAAFGTAGSFNGNVDVSGNFNVSGTKNFKIDHPLDPENKYLYHAAIESSEVLNIYSGNVTTDENGDAMVALPDWFEAINRDFRYQLTVVGTFAQAIIADEISSNRFKIRTSAAGVKVSWQVTALRNDAAIRKHPFKVEEDKSQSERGYFLAPDAYDQPEERGIEWGRNPQMMQQLKQKRIEALQMRKPESGDR